MAADHSWSTTSSCAVAREGPSRSLFRNRVRRLVSGHPRFILNGRSRTSARGDFLPRCAHSPLRKSVASEPQLLGTSGSWRGGIHRSGKLVLQSFRRTNSLQGPEGWGPRRVAPKGAEGWAQSQSLSPTFTHTYSLSLSHSISLTLTQSHSFSFHSMCFTCHSAT